MPGKFLPPALPSGGKGGGDRLFSENDRAISTGAPPPGVKISFSWFWFSPSGPSPLLTGPPSNPLRTNRTYVGQDQECEFWVSFCRSRSMKPHLCGQIFVSDSHGVHTCSTASMHFSTRQMTIKKVGRTTLRLSGGEVSNLAPISRFFSSPDLHPSPLSGC